jgi:hypothetical protein
MSKVIVFCKSYCGNYGGVYNVRHRVKLMIELGYDVIVITQDHGLKDSVLQENDKNILFENSFFDRHVLNLFQPKRLLKTI